MNFDTTSTANNNSSLQQKLNNRVKRGVGSTNKSSNSNFKTAFCGGLAGLTSRAVSSPLDVIKIRLQIQEKLLPTSTSTLVPTFKYNGLIGTFKTILKEEGITGFWKGNLSAEYLYVGYGAIQFLSYKQIDTYLSTQNIYKLDSFSKSFLCGAASGATATIATYPLDLLRTRFAIQGSDAVYQSVYGAIKSIKASEGIAGFYKGLGPTLLQIAPYMGLMFGCYNITKQGLNNIAYTSKLDEALKDSIAGAMSGLVSKLGVYPLDLIKKRRQVQSKLLWEKSLIHYTHSQQKISLAQTIAQIHKQDGILGFYRGVVPALLKSVPTSMTTFLVFGFCQRCFNTNGV